MVLRRPYRGARLLHVRRDLGDQRRLALECELVAEALPELDHEPVAIQVAVPVEQVGFDAPTCAAAIAVYNSRAEIDALIAGLRTVQKVFA